MHQLVALQPFDVLPAPQQTVGRAFHFEHNDFPQSDLTMSFGSVHQCLDVRLLRRHAISNPTKREVYQLQLAHPALSSQLTSLLSQCLLQVHGALINCFHLSFLLRKQCGLRFTLPSASPYLTNHPFNNRHAATYLRSWCEGTKEFPFDLKTNKNTNPIIG